MANLFRLPKVVPVDSSGSPYPGAKANFYATGTSTPQNTYTDSALTTPSANPVVADANGVFAPIYLDPDLTYKLTLTDSADVTIYTVDPVSEHLTVANLGLILHAKTAEETSAGVTPTAYQYEPGDVRRYGAVLDGSTDDSTALTNAISVCVNTGVTLIIKGGDLRINSQVEISAGADTRCFMNAEQDRDARILSYVTGSIATYATAGFGLLFDGWTESTWNNLSLDYDNGTAGCAFRCRKHESISCNINNARIIGGTLVGDRETTTKVSVRYIGNEATFNTAYAIYFHKWMAPYLNIGNILVDMVVGDGDASTKQPNAIMMQAPQFQRYMTAFKTNDTDEHSIIGAWHHAAPGVTHGTNPTITQSGGTATVTHTSHGYATDDILLISGANESGYNINGAKITKTGANSYTYAVDSGTASPATGTITAKLTTVGYRGDTTLSMVQANMEPGVDTIPFYIDDGGSGSNLLILMNNTGLAGVFEDVTEENLLIDRYFYESPLRHRFRVNGADVANFYAAYADFAVPVRGSAFVQDQATVASATNITYIDTAQYWRVTGTTTINTVTAPANGSPTIYLSSTAGSLTVNDDGTSSGNIIGEGSADMVMGVNDMLTLTWDATLTKWVCTNFSQN